MASIMKLKRSAVPGKAPGLADLELGELAINTHDGRVYLKQDDGTPVILGLASLADLAGYEPLGGGELPAGQFDYGSVTQPATVSVDYGSL
ncbi:MAG TPA: hypothetical protein PLY96_10830 [Chromatiaceae bacterium]|nr:hypothetical protein [Chromatiaceae bacterium]